MNSTVVGCWQGPLMRGAAVLDLSALMISAHFGSGCDENLQAADSQISVPASPGGFASSRMALFLLLNSVPNLALCARKDA